ncbi:hypothetical protein B0H11DRAFT_1916267 [Mycena galericulata]|nr:hypothetical protein B0H11DRAFT_1916267 [Mycena galericulata]
MHRITTPSCFSWSASSPSTAYLSVNTNGELACKAVLGVITDMDFAAPPLAGDPNNRSHNSSVAVFFRDAQGSATKSFQLLPDVDTRWSSTLLMIERAVLLREAINKFLSDPDSEIFTKSNSEQRNGKLLKHLKGYWPQRVKYPETAHIIQQGIKKLGAYQERVENVPAYIFAMTDLKPIGLSAHSGQGIVH